MQRSFWRIYLKCDLFLHSPNSNSNNDTTNTYGATPTCQALAWSTYDYFILSRMQAWGSLLGSVHCYALRGLEQGLVCHRHQANICWVNEWIEFIGFPWEDLWGGYNYHPHPAAQEPEPLDYKALRLLQTDSESTQTSQWWFFPPAFIFCPTSLFSSLPTALQRNAQPATMTYSCTAN